MQTKDVFPGFKAFMMLALASLMLAGCLESEEKATSDEGTNPPPSGNAAPQISGSPPTSILMGETYSFTPKASDADNDTLTFTIENRPGWAGFNGSTGQLSGQPTLGDIGIYSNIRIRVSDGTATASLPAFAISVEQVGNLSTTLSWTAPTENEDGSQLVDLAGYRIYWGTSPGVYTNSVTIDNPGITTYVVDNLTAGTYQFVATSFNASGVESRYSNPSTKTLP